jgi:Ca2+-binding RTX toxin-like protein
MTSSTARAATTCSSGTTGDGSDVVEGGAGSDTLQFNGASVNEKIDISANGGPVRFFRDVDGADIVEGQDGVDTLQASPIIDNGGETP